MATNCVRAAFGYERIKGRLASLLYVGASRLRSTVLDVQYSYYQVSWAWGSRPYGYNPGRDIIVVVGLICRPLQYVYMGSQGSVEDHRLLSTE